jgi:hypothetical protein
MNQTLACQCKKFVINLKRINRCKDCGHVYQAHGYQRCNP